VYLNYRKQWLGIEGAPTTGTLNLHLPLNYKAGLGVTAYQDEAGLLKTTTGLLSFSYQVYLGQTVNDVHKIAFGLSAGLTNSRINMAEADDMNDPALGNNTSSLDGQFGLHYQFKNLKLAFAIPRLFQTHTVSEEAFNQPGFEQFQNTLSSVSYDFKFNRISFEPIVTYRTFQNLDAQYEALGVLKIDELGWLGGSYRQDYGAAAFFGLSIKNKIKVGYAYEFATKQTDKFGNGSHEVQLILRVGKKHFSRTQASGRKTANAVSVSTQPDIETEEPLEDEEASEDQEANEEEPLVEQPILAKDKEVIETIAPAVLGNQMLII
jgi:type IX secretion system PorP/SprF family membrane protein